MGNFRRITATLITAVTATAAFTATAAAQTPTTTTLEPGALEAVELPPGESTQFAKGETAEVIMDNKGKTTTLGTLSQQSSLKQTAPNCVVARAERGFVQVYNNCGGTNPIRVKVVLALGPDTRCMSVQPGTRANIGPAVGRIDRVILC